MYRIKSVCKGNALNRRRKVSDDHICKMMENELNTSLSCVGYHQITENLCLKYGVDVAKENLLKALKSFDLD